MHFSNVHFVLCQNFGLNHLTPPFHAFFSPLLSVAYTPSELKWAITSPKKDQAMQKYHEEQGARSKGARLSPLDKISTDSLESLEYGRNVLVITTTKIFPKALRCKWEAFCNTHGRRTAIQMGGVLRYRWEEY